MLLNVNYSFNVWIGDIFHKILWFQFDLVPFNIILFKKNVLLNTQYFFIKMISNIFLVIHCLNFFCASFRHHNIWFLIVIRMITFSDDAQFTRTCAIYYF